MCPGVAPACNDCTCLNNNSTHASTDATSTIELQWLAAVARPAHCEKFFSALLVVWIVCRNESLTVPLVYTTARGRVAALNLESL